MPRSDNPIDTRDEDLLGRRKLAEEVRDFLKVLSAEQGHVLALTGPWGSGKTSFLALLKEAIEGERVVIDFNPWMFSGTNQLVEIFFRELAAQLSLNNKNRFAKVVGALDDYCSLLVPFSWVPFVGPGIKHAKEFTAATRNLTAKPDGSVLKEKAILSDALAELDSPILVFVDDIDRLTSVEVQDLFKLVRLTASFPRVIYILAYDRFRVEEALTQTGMPGRDYLEKIVQTNIDLPAIPEATLQEHVASALQEVIDETGGVKLFSSERWVDVFAEVILPLVRNMRDVRRYASSCHLAVAALKERVELVDILALEAIRVFRPDLMAKIVQIRKSLTSTAHSSLHRGDSDPATPVQELLDLAGNHRDVAEALVTRLFPAAAGFIRDNSYASDRRGEWLRKRTVAHADILALYLERVGSASLTAFDRAEVAFGLMADGDALDTYIRELPLVDQEGTIAALHNFENDFDPRAVVPASTTLLNLYAELPERPRQMFGVGAREFIGRTCLKLLELLPLEGDRETAVEKIMVQVRTLSAKFELLSVVGHWENVGGRQVSEEFANKMSRWLVEQVRASLPEDLSTEVQLLQLVYLPQRIGVEALHINSRYGSDFTLSLLRGARSESISQSSGSRAMRRTPTLPWDILIKLYGSEAELVSAIRLLVASSQDDAELIALATKYSEGYRDRDFG